MLKPEQNQPTKDHRKERKPDTRREATLKLASEASELRYHVLFENNLDAIFLTIPDGRITAANPAACSMLGMTEEEICLAGRHALVEREEIDTAQALAERLLLGRVEGELTMIRKDGTRLRCEYNSVIIPGKDLTSFVIVHDITKRKQAEKGLLQSEKLAAVGRLASSIAHEINNPLESISNLLFLARGSKSLEEIQDYLTTAEQEMRRVAIISSQTLRFHKQSTHPKRVTYEDLLDTVLSIHQGRLVNSKVAVQQWRHSLRPVLCFDGEIRQVINNIVSNAIDAMHPEGGRLLIRSHEATHWQTGRKGLALVIADTGSGISPAVKNRMFEAFFTTKGMAGTGLGLWVSQEIVARHQGILRMHSNDGGTVFTLFLPFDALAISRD